LIGCARGRLFQLTFHLGMGGHYRAPDSFSSGARFLLDIGGHDIHCF
jgi:hypothetical protein